MDSAGSPLARLASLLGIAPEVLTVVLLLAAGALAHLLVGILVRHLHRAATSSAHNWDDVIVTALARPVRGQK